MARWPEQAHGDFQTLLIVRKKKQIVRMDILKKIKVLVPLVHILFLFVNYNWKSRDS
jgi:hypothetical protein